MRETVEKPVPPKSAKFLYYTKFGGLILRLVSRRFVSKAAGAFLSTRLSAAHIKKFVKKHGIDMSCYEPKKYKSFNDFFIRRIKPECRPFDSDPIALVAPCDAYVSVYAADGGKFAIKGFEYTAAELLGDDKLAEKFKGGICAVFRLTPTHYHRYFFIDGGTAYGNKFIKGRLHTVQPVALEKRRVFTENCREVTLLDTDRFGTVASVEVGAMMVGKIVNDVKEGRFEFGQEKGHFEFGGSTVVLLFEKNRVQIDAEFFENTKNEKETAVKVGERIGSVPSIEN